MWGGGSGGGVSCDLHIDGQEHRCGNLMDVFEILLHGLTALPLGQHVLFVVTYVKLGVTLSAGCSVTIRLGQHVLFVVTYVKLGVTLSVGCSVTIRFQVV